MNPIRWRDRILVNFPSPGPSLTLVADPDGLLQEPELRTALAFRGYQVLDYEDPVLFRVRFERDFFPLLEDPGGLQVAVRTDAGRRLEDLPADLLPRGRRLNLSLAGLFPRLSYPVLQRLGADWLDRLEEAGAGERGPSLGPEATLDFLTRQVFGLHLRDLRQPTRLVARLLEMHYHQEGVPDQIARRVARELAGEPDLGAWPLERLWSDRAAFLSFLQEQWEVFLRSLQQPDHGSVCEPAATMPPRSLVPFQAPQVRVFVDTLFLEGLLQPVRLDDGVTLPAAEAWAQVGIRIPGPEDAQRRLEALLARSREPAPSDQDRASEWLERARQLGELRALADAGTPQQQGQVDQHAQGLDEAFYPWLVHHYGGLATLPAVRAPVMVHHVPRFLARQLQDGQARRVALVVVDGLSLGHWAALRDSGTALPEGVRLQEGACFAWIPTLTSLSRQALFAGELPVTLGESLASTAREGAWWRRFWETQGLSPGQVGYLRSVRNPGDPEFVELTERDDLQALGLVVPTVDEMLHGVPGERAVMQATLLAWAGQGVLAGVLRALLEKGYTVWLTADHGSTAAVGMGRPREGSLVDQAGSRARVYPDAQLRERVLAEFPEALPWPGYGLPRDFQVLLAPPGRSFTPQARPGAPPSPTLTHGGASLEEVLVPLVRLQKEEVS